MKWQVLAGVRFFLAGVVMCSHLVRFVSPDDYLLKFEKFGSLTAVIGFLIISGYSIAHSINNRPHGFYKRRLHRVYPLYVCAILFSLLPFLIARATTVHVYLLPTWQSLLGNLFLLQGFAVERLSSDTIVWTLSIEFLCYALAPIFIKTPRKILLAVVLSSALLYFAYCRYYFAYHLPYFTELKYGLSFMLLLWAWLLGFLLFICHQKALKFLLIVLGLFLLKISLNNGTLYLLTYALCILPLASPSSFKLPTACLRLFSYLGDISYPLYLFHLPCFILICGILKISNSFVLVGGALLTSIAFYYLVDTYSQEQRLVRTNSRTPKIEMD